jgi:sugar phosphate isomerase/epimerase
MSLLGRIGVYIAVCLFLCTASFLSAQANNEPAASNCPIPEAQSAKTYGAQLYTVRTDMERDFESSLCRIAQIGYREVEFAGLYGRDPNDVRALLQRYKLKAVASHADWRQLRDDPQRAIRDAKSLGAKYLVFAWLPPEERQTLVQWRWWVEFLNNVGAIAADEGIALLYHAHDFEYRPIDGTRPIDLLQEQLDPRFVNFEMDVYWTVKGGGDPVALLRQYPGRFPLAHVKDMQKDNPGMADVGDGRIDFAAIFKAAGAGDFLHKFVERDQASEPFETLRRSLKYLKSIERDPTK